MSETDPRATPSGNSSGKVVIEYASAVETGSRRWWVYLILVIYLLLVGCLLTTPLWIGKPMDPGPSIVVAGVVIVLVICGMALMLTPIRIRQRRPISRRVILIPIIASGLLLGGLVAGGGFALAELYAPETSTSYQFNGQPARETEHNPTQGAMGMAVVAAVAVWIAWSVLFIVMTRQRDPASVGMKLHRILIAGSVLELLVAVPSHIIVRRRHECCGGILTGMGICIGVAIALVSFGPTVLLLYHRRCKQIKIPSRVARK